MARITSDRAPVQVSTSDGMVAALEAAGAAEVRYSRYTASPAPCQPTDWATHPDGRPARADGSDAPPAGQNSATRLLRPSPFSRRFNTDGEGVPAK